MHLLETERLLLRTPTISDFEDYATMGADGNVMRYLSQTGRPMERHDAWRAFAVQAGHWSLRGFGMFAVVERRTAEFVGMEVEHRRLIR